MLCGQCQQCTNRSLHISQMWHISQCPVVLVYNTGTGGEWITDSVIQVGTIGKRISQVAGKTERIFSAVLHVEKSILISVLFVNLPDTGTNKHKQDHSTILTIMHSFSKNDHLTASFDENWDKMVPECWTILDSVAAINQSINQSIKQNYFEWLK